MRRILTVIILVLIIGLPHMSSFAAVGCTLNDPDRDVKRLFPESTGYRTVFITIKEKGGEALRNEIENQLGDTLEPIYESIDVPYSFYTVLKGKEIIGYMHGVNQKGRYGGMQLILATELKGGIKAFYYQKMSSPEAGKFMDKEFTDKFTGLSLQDFLTGNLNIADPSINSSQDFAATLRGLKKNLILFNKLLPEKAQ
ncbi:MAG: hypothetical protein KKH29_03215 [Candidatus Omnitrophica bacterium]|nr:hypothetical protein [Candidatus Omnitrophota bacterium]MBU4473220.1 hypothetical protein [Candidatus Omnitrophota bacterium]